MPFRTPLILSVLLIVAMVAVSLYFAQVLPPDVEVATHFTVNGTPDGSMSLVGALSTAPMLAAFVALLMGGLQRVIPDLSKPEKAVAAVVSVFAWIAFLVLLFAIHCGILLYARDHHVHVLVILQLVLATIIMVEGCFLGHIRRNRFFGVRTPWTRNSDYAWQRTNRFGGGLMVFWGLVWAGWLLARPQFSPVPVFILLALSVFALYPLSFFYAKHELKAG